MEQINHNDESVSSSIVSSVNVTNYVILLDGFSSFHQMINRGGGEMLKTYIATVHKSTSHTVWPWVRTSYVLTQVATKEEILLSVHNQGPFYYYFGMFLRDESLSLSLSLSICVFVCVCVCVCVCVRACVCMCVVLFTPTPNAEDKCLEHSLSTFYQTLGLLWLSHLHHWGESWLQSVYAKYVE